MDIRREDVYVFLMKQKGPFGEKWAREFGIDAALQKWNTIRAACPFLSDKKKGLKDFNKMVVTAMAKFNRDNKTNKGARKNAHHRQIDELAKLFNDCYTP